FETLTRLHDSLVVATKFSENSLRMPEVALLLHPPIRLRARARSARSVGRYNPYKSHARYGPQIPLPC
ncbi:MAG: hypothetical protein VX034_00240, partial [Planctomycetota bacterium]|nr:hypothetical protein [Planctomycetota bacterium]